MEGLFFGLTKGHFWFVITVLLITEWDCHSTFLHLAFTDFPSSICYPWSKQEYDDDAAAVVVVVVVVVVGTNEKKEEDISSSSSYSRWGPVHQLFLPQFFLVKIVN